MKESDDRKQVQAFVSVLKFLRKKWQEQPSSRSTLHDLSVELGISRNRVYDYITYLVEAQQVSEKQVNINGCIFRYYNITQTGLNYLKVIEINMNDDIIDWNEVYRQLSHVQKNPNNLISPEVRSLSVHPQQIFVNSTVQQEGVEMRYTNFSNVSGSNVNIDSMLEQVTQSVNAIPRVTQAEREQLAALVLELSSILKEAPKEADEDARRIADRVDTLVKEAQQEKPDKEKVDFSLDSLRKAAENVATVLPTVLPVAIQLAEHIRKVTG